jgi:hypothetical protein
MDLRLAPTLVLLLGAVLAQNPTPVPPAPAPAPVPPPQQQDPDKPKPSPAQEAEALAAERHRLELEIAYVRERAAKAKALLAEKLAPRQPTWKAIDAGVAVSPVPAMPVPMQPRQARVANPDELADHGNDTLMVVNGRAVPQGAFDALMEHLAKASAGGDEAFRAQRALHELIQLEGIASQFQENEAAERTGDLLGQLEAGKPIAELAKSVGTVRGATPEGRIELTRNSMYGLRFEQVAFATEPGKRARPFRNQHGLVILQVDSVEKGDKPQLDKVVLHAIQIPYTPDPQQLQKVQASVGMGQVDVLVRDQKTFDMLPQMYRGQQGIMAAPQPDAGRDTSAIERALKDVSDQMEALKGKDDTESQAKLKALQTRYDQLKLVLRTMQQPAPGDKTDAVDARQGEQKGEPKPGQTGDTPAPAPEKPKTPPAPEKPKAPEPSPKNG